MYLHVSKKNCGVNIEVKVSNCFENKFCQGVNGMFSKLTSVQNGGYGPETRHYARQCTERHINSG